MKKEIEAKKTKLVTKTYMKEVFDYKTLILKENDDYFITIKKVLKTTEPFSLFNFGVHTVHIDDGYYVVEITPLKEKYNCRVFIDNNKNIIDYYFDVSLYNGVLDKVPFYVDLYLDVLFYPNRDNLVKYDDLDELDEALKNKLITKKTYDKALRTKEKLTKELKEGTNKYVNLDIIKILNDNHI